MSLLVTRLLLALLLFAIGVGLGSLASVEQRVANATRLTATLSPNASDAFANIDTSIAWLGRVPRVGNAIRADVREAEMVADYSKGSFMAMADDDHGGSAASDAPPDQLFMTANAALRAALQTPARPEAAMRTYDAIAKRYADVLERQPGHVDAAYNHEYVLRLRSRIARTNRTPVVAAAVRRKGDLPAGQTIHGVPGGPPRGVEFGQFEMLIPLTPEEADIPDDGRNRARRGKG